MKPGLALCHLQCHRSDRMLFTNLNAQVLPGQLLRVMGANGAGKTSLLRMICGLLAPTQGAIFWNGKPPRSMREAFAQDLIYIGHATATKDDLTTLENLRSYTALRGLRLSRTSAVAALQAAGLGQHTAVPARLLSQGQRRRLALTRLAVRSTSRLWVLDEPFTALDAHATQWLSSLLQGHARHGGITVLTSHHDVALHPSIDTLKLCL